MSVSKQPASSQNSPADRLDSWKDIATYLKRDLRTVQRWEQTRALPVYRAPGGKRNAIFALKSELDHWWHASKRELDSQPEAARESSSSAVAPLPTGIPAYEMVGRDAERSDLLHRLDDAIAGRGSLVMIGGEPGIGKTRLAEEILSYARTRGCFCLVGHCYEMEGAPPYIPFTEMLEYTARTIPSAAFRRALGDSAPEVAKLMPELRRLFPDIPPPIELPPERQRRFLFNAYQEFFERASRMTPLAVVFEDLHWADESSLLLLHHLTKTLSETSALILGTYREVELDVMRPFAKTLETLLRQRLASRLALRPLLVSGVEEMLNGLSGQPPPPSLAKLIFDETDGNPFFVEEVFRHLREEGKLFNAEGVWRLEVGTDCLEVPEGVRLVIGRRLERLGEAARRVLTTAAVIGRSFSLRVLEAVEAPETNDPLNAIEEAERSHLVTSEPSRDPRYRFSHELVRQTLADAISLPRRQRLHARAADAIERVYGPAAEKHAAALAHHFYQAGTAVDPDRATNWIVRAAEQARAAAAHHEALGHIDDALSLWEGEGTGRVADLYAQRATTLRSLGRANDAITAYERAIDIFDAIADPIKAAAMALPLSMVRAWGADILGALASIRQALNRLADRDPGLRCQLLFSEAQYSAASGDTACGEALLAKARVLQKQLACPDLDGFGDLTEAYHARHMCDFERCQTAASRASAAFRTAGDAWREVESSHFQPMGAICTGHPTDASQLIAEAMPLAERVGHVGVMWSYQQIRAWIPFTQSDILGAERLSREATAFGEAHEIPWRFYGYGQLGDIAFLRGQTGAAIEYFRRAMTHEPAYAFGSGRSQAALFSVLAQENDPHALDMLDSVKRHLPVPGKFNPDGAWETLMRIVVGLAALKRNDEVANLLASAEDFVDTGCWWYSNCLLCRTVAGIAAACARNWTRSEEHHQTALHHAGTYIVAQPFARDWYARMLLARKWDGDVARARVLLGECLALYESIGIPGHARRASECLALLGK